MISLNKMAMEIVKDIIENSESMGCKVIKMDCGVNLIDMGINCPGSWKAALAFTRATIGDLGIVNLGTFKLNDHYTFASVEMYVDMPKIACLGSEIAGWKLGEGEFATIGSGPARATARVASDWYFEMTDYSDNYHEAVLCIQDVKYPTDQVALDIAKACRVKPEDTYLLIAPSTCIVSSMQVSARMLEQSCHKMFEKHFSVDQVVLMRGSAPIAPIVKDELKAMGRINDALIYGSEVELWVDSDDATIAKVIHQLTANTSSPNYGDLFEEVFDKAGRDFFFVDHDVHSLGKVQIHNVNSGRAFCAGEINYKLLEKSFLR